MKIILKEDNIHQRKYFKKILQNLSKNHQLQLDITTTTNIKEIVNYNRQIKEVINILDIMDDQTHEETGIKAAVALREYNPNAYIIFLTAYDSFVLQAVNSNIEPIAYLNKSDPLIEQKLEELILKITKHHSRYIESEKLSFITETGDKIHIDVHDIYMIETIPNRQKHIKLETGYHTYICRGNLNNYLDLSKDIVQCHKSILVNKTKIHEIKKGLTPKTKTILFDNKLRKEFPPCILSYNYKKNLI